jgi:hypothetical protein
MDPNWSSGPRSGNRDRVQIGKPVSLGKTPKDVFKPPLYLLAIRQNKEVGHFLNK